MKSHHSSIILSGAAAAAMLLLTGCAKENGLNAVDKSCAKLELTDVNSGEMLSKAAIDGTGFPRDGRIGLFFFKDEAGAELYGDGACSNVEYSYNQDKSKWTASPAIRVGSTPGYLYGYYPYNGADKDVKSIAVESSLDGDDAMYVAKQDPVTDQTAGNVAITMRHALARVSITVKNKGYSGAAKLSRIEFVGAKTAQKGTLNALDGSITATKSDVTLEVPEANQQITEAGTRYECLLVPSEVDPSAQNVTLRLTIDGQQKTVALTGENTMKIVSGVKARLTIDISDSGLSVVGGIHIDEWQTVVVGGHTVTVKLDEEQFPEVANDVLLGSVKVETGNVIVEAYSKSQKRLECYLDGVASCKTATQTIYHYKTFADEINLISYIFTISDISSDIIATIGYPIPESINLSLSSFTAYVGCSSFKLSATVLPDDALNKNFTWSSSNPSVATVDENGRVTVKSEGKVDITATTVVGGITATCTVTVKPFGELIISGKFSVGSSKYVHFSRGNLYYDGSRYCIEKHQYGTNPTNEADRDPNHISHFMWCDDAANARASKYNTEWNGTNKSFFAAKDFTANDISGWFTLSDTQWQYLLEERKTTYGTGILSEYNHRYAAVKVKDMAGLLLFPDEFSWPTEAGDEPITFNTASSTWNDRNYNVAEFNVLQDNGCVFLPAAGNRSGTDGNTRVYNIGDCGGYWSSTPSDSGTAYGLGFSSYDVTPADDNVRYFAYSVRLVTDVK